MPVLNGNCKLCPIGDRDACCPSQILSSQELHPLELMELGVACCLCSSLCGNNGSAVRLS